MEQPSRVGKYEIVEYLGGGMSQVYRARDSVLGREVALKILNGASADDTESHARFLFEARTASNIRHDNIISIYDFGEEDGRPFIVMELLEGESLRDAIREGNLGGFEGRMNIALQVARAVEQIHSKKIIHRDLKPENIHIDASGKTKLMDFGIAWSEGTITAGSDLTVGTPFYMSPEQVLGETLTRQSDVYSFGVLLFELLTGEKAVAGDHVEAIFHKILYDPLDLSLIHTLRLPSEVGDLIERCTAKPPAYRLNTFAEICAEIEWILNSLPPAEPPRMPDIVISVRKESRLIEKLPRVLQTQIGLMLLAGIGTVFIVAIISFAFLYLRSLLK